MLNIYVPTQHDGTVVKDNHSRPLALSDSMTADEFEDFLASGNCTFENLGWTEDDHINVLSLPPIPPGTGDIICEHTSHHSPKHPYPASQVAHPQNANSVMDSFEVTTADDVGLNSQVHIDAPPLSQIPSVHHLEPKLSSPPLDVSKLVRASSNGDTSLVKAIIREWEQASRENRSPRSWFDDCFRSAMEGGHLSVALCLVDWGVPVKRAFWEDDFKRAMDLKLYGFLQLFLDHGFDINHEFSLAPFSSTALSRTYYHFYDIEMTRWLLDRGADPNHESRGCWAESTTPLSWAVLFAPLDTIKLLFDFGGPSSIQHGYLLYHAAQRTTSDRLEILEYLLKQGGLPDLNKLEYHDNPILASERNHYSVCTAPIHVAASKGHLDVVQLLIARSADPVLQNAKGQLAIDLAREKDHDDIVEYLSQLTTRTRM
ncbi:MAG: hypothetical protein Q9199_003059 [Rusavskia elegans]